MNKLNKHQQYALFMSSLYPPPIPVLPVIFMNSYMMNEIHGCYLILVTSATLFVHNQAKTHLWGKQEKKHFSRWATVQFVILTKPFYHYYEYI